MNEVVAAPSPRAGEGATYPLMLALTSRVPTDLVETETGTLLPMYATVPVVIKSADQLKRVQSNIESLNALHGWTDCMVLRQPDDAPAAAGGDADQQSAKPAEATADAQGEAQQQGASGDPATLAAPKKKAGKQ